MSEPTITDLKPVFTEFTLPPHVSLLPVLRALVTTRQRAEAAQAAEDTLVGMAHAEAVYGGQIGEDVLALIDATVALRTQEGA